MSKGREIVRNIIRETIDKLFEYDSFKFGNEKETFVPTEEVSKTAKIAKEIYSSIAEKRQVKSLDEKGDQGNGVTVADKLITKTPLTYPSANKLFTFFNTNESLVSEERKKSGIQMGQHGTADEMRNSNPLLVWNLHGGDKCYEWLKREFGNAHDSGMKSKELRQKTGGMPGGKGPGIFDLSITDSTKQRIHRAPKPRKPKKMFD